MVFSGHEEELPFGYTPLFVVGPRREHLLQVRVSGTSPSSRLDPAIYETKTIQPMKVEIDDKQRLVLACLGQRYLRHEPQPQPVAWSQVEWELRDLRPTEKWTKRKAAWIVKRLREELSAEEGIPGLREHEVPPPVGNTLNHNLITELMASARLVPADLLLLEKVPEA
jgi:hypothetical protein